MLFRGLYIKICIDLKINIFIFKDLYLNDIFIKEVCLNPGVKLCQNMSVQ